MCKAIKKLLGIESPAEDEVKTVKEMLEEAKKNLEELSEEVEEEPKKEEEWIWVDGFKGMDRNMQCRNNFQYEVGKTYDMPEDSTVEACSSGFHMCLQLNDVFRYFNVGDNNRFFQVRALVRKSEANAYGKHQYYIDERGWRHPLDTIDKLAAKSIEIVRELTVDEILEPLGYHEWDERYKALAIAAGTKAAEELRHIDILVDLGYSLPFATWLTNNKKYEIAKTVGSQTDLSMDMKCLMIMNGGK